MHAHYTQRTRLHHLQALDLANALAQYDLAVVMQAATFVETSTLPHIVQRIDLAHLDAAEHRGAGYHAFQFAGVYVLPTTFNSGRVRNRFPVAWRR